MTRPVRDLDGVESTAYLVNESRARQPILSRDPLAPLWIPPMRRRDVRNLWQSFAGTVTPHDDLVVSLRCRSVCEMLDRVLVRHNDAFLISLGAGFSSYPWLAPVAGSLEVDLPANTAAKSRRRAQLLRRGLLPGVDSTSRSLDLTDADSAEELYRLSLTLAEGRPMVVLIEGLLYYLDEGVCGSLFDLIDRFGDQVVAAAVTYWPSGTEQHPVLQRQRRWFSGIGLDPDCTHLSTRWVLDALGPGATVEGPVDQQRRAGCEMVLPEEVLIPEHFATRGP